MKSSGIAKGLIAALVSSLTVLIGPVSIAQATAVNVDFSVSGPSGETLNGYSIYVYDSEFNEAAFASASSEVSGVQTLSLNPGEYSLELYPFDSSPGTTSQHQTIAPSAYRLIVTSSAEISVERNQGGTFTNVTPSAGVYGLQASTADVYGMLLGSDGNPISISENAGVTIMLEKWDGAVFFPADGAIYDFVKPDGSFALEVPVDGDYRLSFFPFGLADYAQSYTPSFSFTVAASPVNLGSFTAATANMSGRVLGPTNSDPIPFINVTVLDQSTGFQAYGLYGFTNESGVWGLNVSVDGSYFLVAEPYGTPGLAKSEPVSFSVVAGVITVEGGLDPMQLDLQLREPNVVVQVRATLSGVAIPVDDVWVNLNSFSAGIFNGAQTGANGDADFFLESTASDWAAYVWLGSNQNFADSFMNFEGTIDSSMYRDENGKSVVTLWLQQPNLTFLLQKGLPGSEEPLKYASIVVSLGNWYDFGFSDETGKVVMNIDTTAIAAANSSLTGTHSLSFTVYPPYGESSVTTFNCETGASQALFCADIPSVTIGQPYPVTDLGTPYLMPYPNTLILVKGPNGEAIGAGAWVSLLADANIDGCSGCYDFLDGAVTDQNGYAGLTVDTASYTVSFSIEIQPPWDTQLNVAAASYLVDNYADLASPAGYALAAPNLTLSIKEPDGTTPSKWSYAIAEKIDPSSGAFIDWIGGSGANDSGVTKLSLPANTSVSLTVFPGPLSGAAITKCTVTVDAASIVSLDTCSTGSLSGSDLTLTLSSGNVTGVLSHSSGQIAGALVVATNGSSTVSAVTDVNGNYGLQLDFPGTWTIEVFYVSDDPTIPGYLNGGTVTSAGTKNLSL